MRRTFLRKRMQLLFFAFLIAFAHSSFPVLWGVIGEKSCSYSVKCFNSIERFLSTQVGARLAQFMLYLILGIGFKKFIMEKGSETVIRSERKNRGNLLSFKNDYCGDPPPEIKTLMSRMRHRGHYQDFGVNKNKGLLIVGPPGVGKTWLVKVLADEVDAETFILDGSKARGGMFRGSGSQLIETVFVEARKTKGQAIVLIDEFDAIGGNSSVPGRKDVESSKKLLVEMQGFGSGHNSNITLIGLTNSPDRLDKAMLRRFDVMKMDLPDIKKREQLLNFYIDKRMQLPKVKENCILAKINLKDLSGELTNCFSQDRLESVVDNVFARVAKMNLNQRKKIIIREKAFKRTIQELKNQMALGERNFLVESRLTLEPMSEDVQRMYS